MKLKYHTKKTNKNLYNSLLFMKFVNSFGFKSKEYSKKKTKNVFKILKKKQKKSPLLYLYKIFEEDLELNIELRTRKMARKKYIFPVPVKRKIQKYKNSNRFWTLALKQKNFEKNFENEFDNILYNNKGQILEQIHNVKNIALKNRAYTHYRWK